MSFNEEYFLTSDYPLTHRTISRVATATKNKNFSRKEDSRVAVTSKTNVTTVKSNLDEKVHPSWEAKQKQKPSIQAFQGKKIVFE